MESPEPNLGNAFFCAEATKKVGRQSLIESSLQNPGSLSHWDSRRIYYASLEPLNHRADPTPEKPSGFSQFTLLSDQQADHRRSYHGNPEARSTPAVHLCRSTSETCLEARHCWERVLFRRDGASCPADFTQYILLVGGRVRFRRENTRRVVARKTLSV